jgi:hypothetical protein
VRNFTTALSATVTAILIGLLVANVASAARAAEIAANKEQQLAAIQDSYSASDLTVQLEAYRTRYSQAYQQLAAAYQALAARDAEYRVAIDSANTASGQLATANASLDARLTDAYQALRDAQAVVAALRSGSPASAPQSPSATATPRPAGTPRPSRPPDD